MSAKQQRPRSEVSTPNTSIISLTASTALPNSDVELGIGVQPAALPESIRLEVERFLAATGSLNVHTKSIRSRLEELLSVYAVGQQGSRTELEQALLHMQVRCAMPTPRADFWYRMFSCSIFGDSHYVL
jgi:hypothetical protein